MSKEIIQIQKDDGTEQFPETVAEAVQVGEKHLDETIEDINDSIDETKTELTEKVNEAKDTASKSVHTKEAATSPATPDTSIYTKGETDSKIEGKVKTEENRAIKAEAALRKQISQMTINPSAPASDASQVTYANQQSKFDGATTVEEALDAAASEEELSQLALETGVYNDVSYLFQNKTYEGRGLYPNNGFTAIAIIGNSGEYIIECDTSKFRGNAMSYPSNDYLTSFLPTSGAIAANKEVIDDSHLMVEIPEGYNNVTISLTIVTDNVKYAKNDTLNLRIYKLEKDVNKIDKNIDNLNVDIQDLNKNIDKYIIEYDCSKNKVLGGYYTLNNAIGQEVNLTINENTQYAYGSADCEEGDIFITSGQTFSPIVRCVFVDVNGIVLSFDTAQGNFSKTYIAPAGSKKIYWNFRIIYPFSIIRKSKLQIINENVDAIQEVTSRLNDYDFYTFRNNGARYEMSGVGGVFNDTLITDSSYSYGKIPCKSGEKFTIYGQYLVQEGYRWAVVNSSDVVIANSNAIGLLEEIVNIPEGGVYLYWSLRTSAYPGKIIRNGQLDEINKKIDPQATDVVCCGDSTTASYLPKFFSIASSHGLKTHVAYCGGENSIGNLSRVYLPFLNKGAVNIPATGDTIPFEICSSWINSRESYSALNFVSLSDDKKIDDVIFGGIKGTLSKQTQDIYGLVVYGSTNNVIAIYRTEADIVIPSNAHHIKVTISVNDVNTPHLSIGGVAINIQSICVNNGYLGANGEVVESDKYLCSGDISVTPSQTLYADNLASGNLYIFHRSESGDPVTIGALSNIYTTRRNEWSNYLHIVFTGQNGGFENLPNELANQIKSSLVGIKKYIVINPWAGGVSTMKLKKEFLTAFGNRFFDLDTFMKEQSVYEAKRMGIITSGEQSDYISIFSSDGTHPNDNGATLWAKVFMNKLIDLGFVNGDKY